MLSTGLHFASESTGRYNDRVAVPSFILLVAPDGIRTAMRK